MSNPTTPFSWQMPTATDLVTDLPADFEVFGQAVATSMADLLGGTTGQVLAKTTNADMDFTWTTPQVGDITGVTAGVGISGGGTSGTVTVTNDMATTITTAGDLIYGTGSGTYTRRGIGSTSQVLTVAGGVPTWATPAATTPTFAGCFIYGTSNQTVANATVTTVNFGAENFDSDGFHSTSVNNSRITIPAGKGGKYLVTAARFFAGNATGFRQIRISVNGTLNQVKVQEGTSQDCQDNASFLLSLAVADYIEMAVYQNSGGSLTLFNTTETETWLSVSYQGA
jgi:hypothetical protein